MGRVFIRSSLAHSATFVVHINYPWVYVESLKLEWSVVDTSSQQIMGKSAAEKMVLDPEDSDSPQKQLLQAIFI